MFLFFQPFFNDHDFTVPCNHYKESIPKICWLSNNLLDKNTNLCKRKKKRK